MSKINVLEASVAALIAAGEVVERPSSVIKELVENSIDANAKTVTVEIKNGGVSYMRVTDDGDGIDREDVPSAFLRHATSKISDADDLENIITLGFRGEALYSIAAVSDLEMMTKRHGETEGTYIKISGGTQSELNPAGCPEGTTIIVRNLFYNTPARMKFLKKDSSEAGLCEDVLRRIALARPDISVRFINGGKEIFYTPGDNNLKNAVYAIYGKDIAKAMIPADYEEGGVKVKGLVGKAELTRGNRNYQTFFVNGRCIINKNLYFALQEAYKSHIMTGRFPVAVLNVEINPALCDVNVHPSKAEVKFADEKAVSGAVYWAAKNALHSVSEQREMTAFTKTEEAKPQKAEPAFIPEQKKVTFDATQSYKKAYEPKFDCKPKEHKVAEAPISEKPYVPTPKEAYTEPQKIETENAPEIKILGQLFGTYIVAERGEDMLMIDQHAAHERLIYEELLKNRGNVPGQMLLSPETIVLSATEFAVYRENEEFFANYGFETEEFGHNTVRVSMIPSSLDISDISSTFGELIETLGAGREKISALQDKALYIVACKAALKAGQKLSEIEQKELIKNVLNLSGEVTCPHGRPVILKLTKHQIEKQFKRIV
ncbi:MAG: DNA mismatch repair endonuclease MutL [Clostridia bacterium]|nr:DNA mismatch repair endonuclease MutL [Clostridia bacterium]